MRATNNNLIKNYDLTEDILQDEADLLVYMAYDITGTGTGVVGIAYLGVVCAANIDDGHLKQSINEWQPTTAEFGAVSFIPSCRYVLANFIPDATQISLE